jgi:hypothetical protein
LKQNARLVKLLRGAVEASSDEGGWAHLAPVGSNIAKQSPGFDPRNYGYGKPGELVAATKLLIWRKGRSAMATPRRFIFVIS